MFSFFIKACLDERTDCIFSKLDDDTIAGTAEGYVAILRDMDRLERGEERDLTKFNKGKSRNK